MQREDFKSMPSQVLCLAAAIKFTQQADTAIETGRLSNLQVDIWAFCAYSLSFEVLAAMTEQHSITC